MNRNMKEIIISFNKIYSREAYKSFLIISIARVLIIKTDSL